MATQLGDWCYTLWLQVVRMLPIDEATNSSLSVVNRRHFHGGKKNLILKDLTETRVSYLFSIGCCVSA
jgi:hypothetical protein